MENRKENSYTDSYLNGERNEFIFVDRRGYERDRGYKGKLVHRLIAYEDFSKKKSISSIPFGGLVVHHIDENKRNNHPTNLQALTIEKHSRIHSDELDASNYDDPYVGLSPEEEEDLEHYIEYLLEH
ncbi:hypothetical protein CXX78_00420 [Candidatus Parvarchaeota archaeon]|nr:MAG: hypothetical protein CXX78_00420 [Candidatus Parvarchaeota archaeon]